MSLPLRPALVALALVATSALGACGSSATPRSAPTTTSSSSRPGGPDPNAPEASPAGDIPDNQVFVAFTGPGFTVKVPEGWARTEAAGAVTFTDHFNSVQIETVAAAQPPTVESARRDEVPAIQAAATNYGAGAVTSVRRPAGDAVLITYQQDSTPSAVTGKRTRLAVERYEFWRSGAEVIVTLSGPVGADNVDPWRTVTESFGWVR